MSEQVEYHMQRPGSTVGRVSGSFRSWSQGDVLVLPKGELEHVGTKMYETRDMRPEPRYVVREGEQGWHKVYDTRDEEYVDGESERSAEAAQANADRLNG
jgi:hypothetical protein